MEYLLAGAVVVLIVALTELVRVIKENEEQLDDLIMEWDAFIDLYWKYWVKLEENTELKNENRAYKWANTKHKATIEKMKISEENTIKIYEEHIEEVSTYNKNQADTIKKLNCTLDESYIAINAVWNEPKKSKRLELLDKYMTK